MSRLFLHGARLLSRGFCSLGSNRISVCIVGSGPAGFYTAEKMLKAHQTMEVDIIDRLPTPFGLVRYGVAPDHPETKIVANQFSRVAKRQHHKVYLVARRGPAQAACTAKELREILGMKNLHIKIQQVDLDISPSDEEELKNQRVQKRVYELLSKAAASPHCPPAEQRELHFVFFRKPDRFLPSENGCTVGAVHLEKTFLEENGSPGKRLAVGTGEFEDITCGLVLKSIGYKSLPIDGLPFDNHKGVVPNLKGRVLSSYQTGHEAVEHGLYVAGWLKRGPIGIVATNLYCAEETVASISEDVEKGWLTAASGTPKPGRQGLLHLLENKNIKFVPFSGWEKIDAKEKMVGQQKNKPREKITTWEELLKSSDV